MGKWYDEESEEKSRQEAAFHFRKAKEGFQKMADALDRDADREEQWSRIRDQIIANPHVVEVMTERAMESHLINAESQNAKLKRKISRGEETAGKVKPGFPPTYAGVVDLISGLGASFLEETIGKNDLLIRLINGRKERERKAVIRESAAEQRARKVAEGVEEMNLTLALLEERRKEANKRHPDQEDANNRRFRKAADAILEES